MKAPLLGVEVEWVEIERSLGELGKKVPQRTSVAEKKVKRGPAYEQASRTYCERNILSQ